MADSGGNAINLASSMLSTGVNEEYIKVSVSLKHSTKALNIVRVVGGDTEGPLQVCHLSKSSESTHFLSLSRDVAFY